MPEVDIDHVVQHRDLALVPAAVLEPVFERPGLIAGQVVREHVLPALEVHGLALFHQRLLRVVAVRPSAGARTRGLLPERRCVVRQRDVLARGGARRRRGRDARQDGLHVGRC